MNKKLISVFAVLFLIVLVSADNVRYSVLQNGELNEEKLKYLNGVN